MSADDSELLLTVICAAAAAAFSFVSRDLLRSARARSLASNIEVGDIFPAAAIDNVSFRWRAEICRSTCISPLPKCLVEESGETRTERIRTNRTREGNMIRVSICGET